MKYIITMALILAIIFGLNYYVAAYIGQSAHDLLDSVQQARRAATAGSVDAAAIRISAMRERWEHDESRWEAFTDHREVERVDILIQRLEGYVDEQTTEGMAEELQELEYLLRQMTEKHSFRIENIF